MKEKVEIYNALAALVDTTEREDTKAEIRKTMKQHYLQILYTNHAGFELTARMTTNYRCLLNIYIQRWDHRLPEWRDFCAQLLELPYFPELVEAYRAGKVNAEI
jgi:hypothetical protein